MKISPERRNSCINLESLKKINAKRTFKTQKSQIYLPRWKDFTLELFHLFARTEMTVGAIIQRVFNMSNILFWSWWAWGSRSSSPCLSLHTADGIGLLILTRSWYHWSDVYFTTIQSYHAEYMSHEYSVYRTIPWILNPYRN